MGGGAAPARRGTGAFGQQPGAGVTSGRGAALGDGPGVVSMPRVAARVAIEEAALDAGESKALQRIVRSLRAQSPEVARELGW